MTKMLLATLALAISLPVFAADNDNSAENKSSLQIQEVNPEKNKVPGDIDQDVTNAKLRAESGSKSKYSLSFTGGYTGGAISQPFGVNRPNLAELPGQQTSSSLDGTLNGRYRMTKNDSITLGTEYSIMTPLQNSLNKEGSQTNFRDPSVAYNRVDKLAGLQTVGTLAYSYGTSNESMSIDMTHQFGGAYTIMHEFQNKVSLGLAAQSDYNMFSTKAGQSTNEDTHPPNPSKNYLVDTRNQWDVMLYPLAEYQINDRYSLRSVFGYFNWHHDYGDPNKYRLLKTYSYQSVGVGIAITRDIYLYPNVQFLPTHIAGNMTNVALSATINVF